MAAINNLNSSVTNLGTAVSAVGAKVSSQGAKIEELTVKLAELQAIIDAGGNPNQDSAIQAAADSVDAENTKLNALSQ